MGVSVLRGQGVGLPTVKVSFWPGVRKNGTTPENVLREMQLAIDHAYDHHDKEAQKLWDMMSFKSDRPTPEEFIFQVAMMLDKNGSLH